MAQKEFPTLRRLTDSPVGSGCSDYTLCARANSGKDGGRDRTRTCTPWEKASKTFAAAITPLARNGGSTWTRTKVARRREIYSLLQLPLCHTPKWRKGWDSNPRWVLATTVFKTVLINHSSTLPKEMSVVRFELTRVCDTP